MFSFRWNNCFYLLWLINCLNFTGLRADRIVGVGKSVTNLEHHSEISSDSQCVYPKNAIYFIIHQLCPVADPLCIIDIPFDNEILFDRIRCSTASYNENNSVELLSPSEMFKRIDIHLQNKGLPLCMISAFYAPNCYFSFQMSPHLNALPRMFPHLEVVAVDASESSRLYTRYGVIGTPTVILWINGLPAFRMDEAPFSLQSFKKFVERRTDLEAIRSVNVTDEDHFGPLLCHYKAATIDWLFLASLGSMLLSICYFLYISKLVKTALIAAHRYLLRRFGRLFL
uniref:Thioredoxin domain-containing protein n=1 Tax=Syphacia muris TaxID=451379 RepID=A0A0N5AVR6_9BILA